MLDEAKGLGCTKCPPEGLVSNSLMLALGGGAAASCPVPHEGADAGSGGAETTGDPVPAPGANGLPVQQSTTVRYMPIMKTCCNNLQSK